jgi:integral membrane sensor domain MASE1
MKLLVFYIVFVAIGEAITYAAGRTVEIWSQSAGIPQRLLLRAVGRLAARRESGLSSGSNNSRAC